MTCVFLAYSHRDEARVRVIERALRDRGHVVFWDKDIPTGENWPGVLQDRVRNAQCVLVAWSRFSVQSKYVRFESEQAIQYNRLVPVILDSVALPIEFANVQWADLRDWFGNVRDPEWQRVVARIEECGSQVNVSPPRDALALKEGWSDTPPDGCGGTSVDEPRRRKGIDLLHSIVEWIVRQGLTMAPVDEDALQDITTIRVRGDEEFLAEVRGLERYGYVVVQRKDGEALLERRRRFSWLVAAMLTAAFVLPALVYIATYPWLPKTHRIYVVQVA